MDSDPRRDLRVGGGCFVVLAFLFGLAFSMTVWRLQAGADSVHPIIWPAWKALGTNGVAALGALLTLLCLAIGAMAIRRSRQP